ncbi:hypothetical protein MGN70_001235 [Eutypa lata]|nr:hypothetical protein MGN70_001235 [Eutypa lata]
MKSFLSKVFHGRHVAEATSSVQHEEEVAPVTGEHQEEGAVGQDAPTTEPGSPVVPAVGPAPAAPGQPLIIPPRFVPAPVPARELNPVHKCQVCGCHYYAAQNNHLACSHHPGGIIVDREPGHPRTLRWTCCRERVSKTSGCHQQVHVQAVPAPAAGPAVPAVPAVAGPSSSGAPAAAAADAAADATNADADANANTTTTNTTTSSDAAADAADAAAEEGAAAAGAASSGSGSAAAVPAGRGAPASRLPRVFGAFGRRGGRGGAPGTIAFRGEKPTIWKP